MEYLQFTTAKDDNVGKRTSSGQRIQSQVIINSYLQVMMYWGSTASFVRDSSAVFWVSSSNLGRKSRLTAEGREMGQWGKGAARCLVQCSEQNSLVCVAALQLR